MVAEEVKIGRCHVKTLMRRMGIEALIAVRARPSRNPATRSTRICCAPAITRPNQVWTMDITYIPMARGFVYLAMVLDWFSRRVLSWRLSITMEAAFCVATLQDALARHGKPDIFNTDQGSQFTSQALPACSPATTLRSAWTAKGLGGTMSSSSGCGAASNTRRCTSAYNSVSEARTSIGRYLDFYNGRRPHSSLDGTTPDQAYFNQLPFRLAA